jgi:phospholipid transport system substrate-binding protein
MIQTPHHRRRLAVTLGSFIVLCALALVGAAGPAAAATPTEELQQHVDQVIKTLDDPALKGEGKAQERQVAVRKIADQIFDVQQTAQRALGPHWQARTPEEREEFVRLFADLLQQAYISKVDRYSGEKVRYVGETVDGDQATVRTRILTKQGSEVPVDYRMQLENGHWRVFDVIIEGVSLVANYRTQFNKIIQTSSYQDLVARLKAKSFSTPEEGSRRRSS